MEGITLFNKSAKTLVISLIVIHALLLIAMVISLLTSSWVQFEHPEAWFDGSLQTVTKWDFTEEPISYFRAGDELREFADMIEEDDPEAGLCGLCFVCYEGCAITSLLTTFLFYGLMLCKIAAEIGVYFTASLYATLHTVGVIVYALGPVTYFGYCNELREDDDNPGNVCARAGPWLAVVIVPLCIGFAVFNCVFITKFRKQKAISYQPFPRTQEMYAGQPIPVGQPIPITNQVGESSGYFNYPGVN